MVRTARRLPVRQPIAPSSPSTPRAKGRRRISDDMHQKQPSDLSALVSAVIAQIAKPRRLPRRRGLLAAAVALAVGVVYTRYRQNPDQIETDLSQATWFLGRLFGRREDTLAELGAAQLGGPPPSPTPSQNRVLDAVLGAPRPSSPPTPGAPLATALPTTTPSSPALPVLTATAIPPLPAVSVRIPIESDQPFRSNPISDSGVSDHRVMEAGAAVA